MLTEDNLLRYWRYSLLIESDLEVTSRFVEFRYDNFSTFSAEYSKIILLTCSEIEVICKLLCNEIEPGFKESNSNLETYAGIILKRFPMLTECKLVVTYDKSIIMPFEEWRITPYSSPQWWKDYQGIKHSRHNNFKNAHLANALNAVAGLIILNLYMYRLVMNKSYARPSTSPKVFDSGYLPGYFLIRGDDGLPDFDP